MKDKSSTPGQKETGPDLPATLAAYHVAPSAGCVKLDAMENPYRLPPDVAERLGRHLAQVAINRYPDPGAPGLKGALRRAMAIPDGLDMVLGNGSDEILQMIAVALARPGATMLALEPSFVMYRLSAIAAGMRYEGVPLAPGFGPDLTATLAAIERSRPALTWIAYPNNPTGNLFPREAILAIIEAVPGLVVVDEAYYAFSGQRPELQCHGVKLWMNEHGEIAKGYDKMRNALYVCPAPPPG